MFGGVNTVGWYYYSEKCDSHKKIYGVKPPNWNLIDIDSNNYMEIHTLNYLTDNDVSTINLMVWPNADAN
jgi:hypothetical protein